jgi:hypothetical protein
MRLLQQLLDCGRPPQARRSGRREQQHHPGFVASAVEIVLELVEVILRQRCKRRLTGRCSFRRPEVPDDHERGDDPDQPKRVLDPSRSHASPGNQAGYHLWEEDDKKDDCGGEPEKGDAQRASLLALIASNVKLNETDT